MSYSKVKLNKMAIKSALKHGVSPVAVLEYLFVHADASTQMGLQVAAAIKHVKGDDQ